MRKSEVALFDTLLTEIENDIYSSFRDPDVQSEEMVNYENSRTGRKATCTYARYLAIMGLLPALRKKYTGATSLQSASPSSRYNAALQEFLDDNARCLAFSATYNPARLDGHLLNGFVSIVRGEVIRLLGNTIVNDDSNSGFSLSNLSHFLRSGPGASSGVPGDPGTFGRLCESHMTFSSERAKSLYNCLCKATRLSWNVELTRRLHYGSEDSVNATAVFMTAPKDSKKDRGICTQPSGNMACQLSIHEVLCRVLKDRFDTDLESQQFKNRHLAYLGSYDGFHLLNRTWNFVTVDLKSASNFPLVLIQDLFPEFFFELVDTVRSSEIQVEFKGDKTPPRLEMKHMCSTMGNGITFSLMTVLLSAIVKVLYTLQDLPEYDIEPLTGRRIKTWAVYGDDIIVDKTVYPALQQVLQAFGFIVNTSKTHTSGFFRESCGGDYYRGTNVRPVYCESLDTQADVYSLLNRLVNWGATHSVDLSGSLRFLRRCLAVFGSEHRVPNWEDVSSGFHVPFSHSFNHQHIAKTSTICMSESLKDKTIKVNPSGRMYVKLAPLPLKTHVVKVLRDKDVPSESCIWRLNGEDFKFTRNSLIETYKVKNIPGVLFCTLGGSVRDGQYGRRAPGGAPTRFREEMDFAPGWGDPSLLGDGSSAPLGRRIVCSIYALWEEYVRRNCFS